jgi:MFS family permease
MNRPPKPGTRKIAVGRIAWAMAGVAVSCVATYFFADMLSNAPEVLGVIAAIFSILAGVLIAVVSILGDPSMLLDQSWRHSYLSAEETQRKIHRQTDVFLVYVLLLVTLFAFMLCPKASDAYRPLQLATFFLTTLAFFASLSLPFTLRAIQKTRLDRAIGHLKNGKPAGGSG